MGLKDFCLQFLVDIILLLRSGSMDPHVFADSDPGSQNVADPTDPDPKHCEEHKEKLKDRHVKLNKCCVG